MQIDERTAWTGDQQGAATQRTEPELHELRGVAVHWPGGNGYRPRTHQDCLDYVAAIDRDHRTRNPPYAAIAYNEVACIHGHVIVGRGTRARSGANGDTTSNRDYGSVLALLGIGDKPSEAMLRAIVESARRQAPGKPLFTHSDVRPHPTACPGPDLEAWVHAGAPLPEDPATTAPTDWDEMATQDEFKKLLDASAKDVKETLNRVLTQRMQVLEAAASQREETRVQRLRDDLAEIKALLASAPGTGDTPT